MVTGKLQSWNIAVGDQVEVGDPLCDVETDKAVMAYESTEEGFVAKLLVEEGTENINIGKPIVVLAESADDIGAFEDYVPEETAAPEATPEPEPNTPAPAETTAPAPQQTSAPKAAPTTSGDSSGRVKASPLARKLAEAAKIALEKVVGTGPGGRITKADVNAYSDHAATASASGSLGVHYTDVPLSNIRKVIASRLQDSKQTIPHYYLNMDLNADAAIALRAELNGKSDGEYKLSLNDLVVKAASLALREVKAVNSAWMDTFIRENETVDISVAVSTDTGLITPIVFDADLKGLKEISNDIRGLAEKARNNGLTPEEYQGGTFTISNLGMFGVNRFTAIINPPQSCILAVGTTEKRVIVDDATESGFRATNIISVTLSCDHRVVDGAVGAQWLASFKKYFEDPVKMLL